MPPGSDDTTRIGAPAAPAALPREATLDGFVQCTSGAGISLRELEPLTTLLVGTCNTQYRIIVSRQSAILVQGGRFFPEVTTATLDGSSAGGSFLKVAWIGVGLRMEISAGGQRIVTSPVRSITTERESQTSRPH
jgi:hypothetical protein